MTSFHNNHFYISDPICRFDNTNKVQSGTKVEESLTYYYVTSGFKTSARYEWRYNSEINHNNEESPEINYMGWLIYEADGPGG